MNSFALMRLAFMMALCGAFIGTAQAQVSPQLAQKAPEAAEIAAVVAQQGFVRVIVQIAAPAMPNSIKTRRGVSRSDQVADCDAPERGHRGAFRERHEPK